MSANSGILVSQDLVSHFSAAVESGQTRFLKVVIQNESLELDTSISIEASFESDLEKLQNPNVLHEHNPAYILAKLDEPALEWLVIYYVPESAKVRDKMLYAATRASLLKGLGSTVFTDTIFATSKSDVTADAYRAHRRHITAPQPLSLREQEMADVRAAESGGAYEGSRGRSSALGTGVGLHWHEDVENAVRTLGEGSESHLLVIKINTSTETLILDSSVPEVGVEVLVSTLPSSEPCYAFFAWPHNHTSPPRREIIFIYSCPSSSPIKNRMLYSSGSSTAFQTAKTLLSAGSAGSHLASRKIETSDPSELTEEYLVFELGLRGPEVVEKKPFGKPKGPSGRRR